MTRACNCNCSNISITEGVFGEIHPTIDDDAKESSATSARGEGDRAAGDECEAVVVKGYTLENAHRMKVVVITWGASIVSIKCPDKYGDIADVVMAYDNMENYMDPLLNQFMGSILGRCANRIEDGRFKLKDKDYFLPKNECDKHHLHGGVNGFGRRVWEAHVEENSHVVMTYLSEDNEEGYPGTVLTTVKFTLTDDNRFVINMRATTTKPTIVNLSHGSLFNLGGHDAGEEELRAHKISLNCDRWTYAEFDEPIPSGAIRGVGGTVMDLRVPRLLGEAMDLVPQGKGFDHNFGVIRANNPDPTFVARAFHPKTGRFLEVYSDQPGVQLYTGGRLPPIPLPDGCPSCGSGSSCEEEEEASVYECPGECSCESQSTDISVTKTLEFLPGKCCAEYKKFGAFSIQPQNYPNAINIPHFPCPILRPGQVYYHDLIYKFGIQLNSYM